MENIMSNAKEKEVKAEAEEEELATDASPSLPLPPPPPSSSSLKPTSSTKTNSVQLNSSHRVSFRQELDNAKEYFNDVAVNKNNIGRKEQNPKASGRVRVGKVNPIRDVGIGVGILIVLFLVANSFSELGSPRPIDDGVMVKPITKKSTKLQQIKQALGELLQAQSHPHLNNPLRPKDLPCPLLLYPSRIAHSGWGLYAGQNYSTGQEIMILAPPLWIIPINDDPTHLLSITPEALLFKHHPTLNNIESSKTLWTTTTTGTGDTITIQATRPIEQGQELYLDYDQHLHSVLPHWYDSVIPTLDDYNEATEVLFQARKHIRDPPGPRGRSISKQHSVVGSALRMVQQVMARYRPAAAKLMGTSLETIAHYRGKAEDVHCLELGLKNITWNSIARHGMCISDVVAVDTTDTPDWPTTTTTTTTPPMTSTSTKMTTVHAVPKGHRFHPIPVLLQRPLPLMAQQATNEECMEDEPSSLLSSGSCSNSADTATVSFTTCWSWAQDQKAALNVCPLQQAFRANNLVAMASRSHDHDTNPSTTPTANVQLQWSQWKQATEVLNSKLEPPAKLTDQLELLLMMDLIAVQDLQAGDELVLAMEIDSISGDWVLSPDLLPAQWITTTQTT